jgi:adenosylmethionine-8-amino-7-oxononanoate aminotransferase
MDIRRLDQEHLIHPVHSAQDQRESILFASGEGALLRDGEGREYLDGLASLWNVHAGHGRKELAQAAADQMVRLAYASAYSGFTNEPAVRLAHRLLALAYPNLSGVYFTTGGAESNETAFKMARYVWRRRGRAAKTKIISRYHAYHGLTLGAMSATGIPAFHKMFAPVVPGFVHVLPSYPYRYPTAMAVDALDEAIRREGPESVAGVIAEPVIGAGGVIAPAPDYFPAVREICDRYEVLLIADEIITGFGRTGRWFALDHWGVRPDMVTFAKGVTSAYLPLGGVMVSREIHSDILDAPAAERFMHAATYSGHPACCAVGLANLDILEGEGLVARAAAAGRRLLDGLATLRELPGVGDVRGLGLMAGIELVADKSTKAPALGMGARVLAQARQRGLITRIRAGQEGAFPIGDVICVAPPLIVTDAQVDRIVAILGESLRAAAS